MSNGDRLTEYGFTFGAAEIERIGHIEGRHHVLRVKTKHRELEIYISPKGRSVRVFENHKEIPTASMEAHLS